MTIRAPDHAVNGCTMSCSRLATTSYSCRAQHHRLPAPSSKAGTYAAKAFGGSSQAKFFIEGAQHGTARSMNR